MSHLPGAGLLLASGMALLTLAGPARGENIAFPADAGVIDLTRPPYSLSGDGQTDCTEAIRRALIDHAGKDATLYLPNGTYQVSGTLSWAGRATRNILQGQSTDGTVIRLQDRSPGFTDPGRPRAVIVTGYAPPQRFRNAIRNLTVDTGRANPGAIGIRFNASNQGQMNSVAIRSGDGAGVIGLDLGYTGDVGPLLVTGLRVEGFDLGIHTAHATAAQTLEDVTLRDQRVCGWVNDGQALAIRRFVSHNAVPAFWNKRGPGMVTLLDARCEGAGAAAQTAAIINESGLLALRLKTTGYRMAIDGSAGAGRSVTAPDADQYASHEVLRLFPSPPQPLNLPVEEVPRIPWDDPADWVSVARFPPQEATVEKTSERDGKVVRSQKKVMDWTSSVQRAIDSGAATVYFPRDNGTGQPYEVLGTVHLRGNVRRVIGMEGGFGPESRPVFQLDDGQAPAVIIERFDWMYCPTLIRTASRRALVVSALTAYLDVGPDGQVFTQDNVMHFRMARGSRMWMRQWNTEYTHEARHGVLWPDQKPDLKTHPGNLNDGGQLWVLGIKTEGDGTLLTTLNGGRSEVLGALVYANKNGDPDKRAFVVRDASLSLSLGEWVIRQQPFNMVQETRGGETRLLKPGVAPGRGGGGLYVLFNGYDGPGNVEPAGPASSPAPPRDGDGAGLRGQYFTGQFEQPGPTRTEPVDFDWTRQGPLPGARTYSVRWTGQLEARRSGPHGFATDLPGTRLLVDGRLVVDAWDNAARYRSGHLSLEAGRRYDVKLEYHCDGRNAGKVRLLWTEPGGKSGVVPASQLYPAASTVPTVRLVASAAHMPEKGGEVEVRVARTGDTAAPLTVDWAPRVDMLMSMVLRFDARGNAVSGRDYLPLPEKIVIPAGEASATVRLTAIDDPFPQPPRQVILALAPSERYDVAGGPVKVAIDDDDLPPAGQGAGLSAEYFAGRDFSDLKAARVDPVVDFAWDKAAPVPGIDPLKGYAIRWSGQLQPLFSETYRLEAPMTVYGALRVWLDGKEIITVTNPGTEPGGRFGSEGRGARSARVPLEAGRRYDLKIEYVCLNSYGSNIRLLWSSDRQYEQVIPAGQLDPAPGR